MQGAGDPALDREISLLDGIFGMMMFIDAFGRHHGDGFGLARLYERRVCALNRLLANAWGIVSVAEDGGLAHNIYSYFFFLIFLP